MVRKTVPTSDNKFSALNSAVFMEVVLYSPPGVKLEQPLQAYFRINAEKFWSIRTHINYC